MTEIYTKPFESVHAAITLFEQKTDPNKRGAGSNKEGKEGEFLKDLTNCRLQLEAKEREKDLTFFEFDASHKSPQELLNLLKLYKAESDKYKEKFRNAQALFLEFEKGEHLFHSVGNVNAKEEVLHFKRQVTVADESMNAAKRQAEMMKTSQSVEKENGQEFVRHISQIKEVILSSQLPHMEAEEQSFAFIPGMEKDLRVPEAEVFHSQIQLEVLRSQMDKMEDLENELLKEVIIAEYLHMELKQLKEAQATSSKAALSVLNELDLIKSETEQMKLINSESANYILEIEDEGKRMKELKISSEKINGVNCQIEMLVGEIQRMQEEMSKSNKRELELQEKVTTLTYELHNCNGWIAASEEKETSPMSAQAGLSQAMQQLAVESEEGKSKVQRQAECNKAETKNEGAASNKISAFIDADSKGFCTGITISLEEYELLIQKSQMFDNAKSLPNDGYEVNKLKIDLEDKNAEINELTCMLQEAVRRVELSEKAKLAVENQLRMWREQQQVRRAASEARKDYSGKKHEVNIEHEKPFLFNLACIKPELHDIPPRPKRSVSMNDGKKSKYVPLGKLLKIKFQQS